MKLIISVVTWNNENQIETLINSLETQKIDCETQIVISDNASTDNTCEKIKEFNSVILIENPQNLGFGKAHTKVMNMFDADYYFVLNPDCKTKDPLCIQKLLDFAKSDKDLWIAGPKILNNDDTVQWSVRSFPNSVAAIIRSGKFEKLFLKNKLYRKYLMLDYDHNKIFYPDWLSGAAMLIKKDVIDEIGGFDNRYFMYVEDMDLCKEVHNKGKKIAYYPEAVLYHTIGTSSDKNKANCIKMHHESMFLYYMKYANTFQKIFCKPFVVLGIKLRLKSILKSLNKGE